MGLLYEIRRPDAEKEKLTRRYLCPGAIRVLPDFTDSSLGYVGVICDLDNKGAVLDVDEDVASLIEGNEQVDTSMLEQYPVLLSVGFVLSKGKVDFKPDPAESAQIIVSQYEPTLN